VRTLLLHPPLLPYAYTLHHRFARVWEVADYLKRKAFDLTVFDAGLLNCLKGHVVREFGQGYDVVLIYCENQAIPTVVDLAYRCRALSPNTRIMVYGPAPICYPDQLRLPIVDGLGRRGDLECQVRQFLEFAAGERDHSTNVALRRGDEWVEPTGPSEMAPPDDWGYPRFDEMPMDDIRRIYEMKKDTLKVAITCSKGCPYPCTFCHIPSVEGTPDRRRDASELAAFIADNQEFEEWQFYSPTFTLDRDWCLSFFDELERRDVHIRWKCTTRVDRLDDELIEAMARSGCYVVGLGIETLGAARKTIRKGITDDQIGYALESLTAHGILAKGYIMLGLPGQPIEDFRETVRFVEAHGGKVRPYIYVPQGEADRGRDEVELDEAMQQLSGLDGRSWGLETEQFGEFLRLAFSEFGRASPNVRARSVASAAAP
jgi:anaerobic magnesium-protoporphyrin IX monomethyl ester cyclase